MSAQTPRLAALTGILALVGTLGSSFATPSSPGTYGRHPVKWSFPGSLEGFQENGEVIVTAGGYANGPQYWDVKSGQLRDSPAEGGLSSTPHGWGDREHGVLSPDGATRARQTLDGILLLDVAAGQVRDVLPDSTEAIGGVVFSPDGSLLASIFHIGEEGGIRIWDLAATQLQSTISIQGVAWDLDFSPDGETLATTRGLWNVASAYLHSSAYVS